MKNHCNFKRQYNTVKKEAKKITPKKFMDAYLLIEKRQLKKAFNTISRRKDPVIYFRIDRLTRDQNGNSKKWFNLYVVLENRIVEIYLLDHMKQNRKNNRMFFVDVDGVYSWLQWLDGYLNTKHFCVGPNQIRTESL
jgi:DNA invertase Pin-like site-specific DNA recombinase